MNTTDKADIQVPVLIVGGGVAGLSALLCLQQQGITPLLVEKHKGTSIHPRARGFDARTMEIFRELGISGQICEAGKALAPAWGILHASSVAAALEGKKPGKKSGPEKLMKLKGLAGLSPEKGARCTQDLSEPVLVAAAKQRGADVRFNTELESFTQHDDCVIAYIRDRDTREALTVRADYMIAADGAKSGIRETLRAPVTGTGVLGNLLNIYFEADLEFFVKGREFSILLVREPDMYGMLTAINNSNRWVFHLHYDTSAQPEDLSEERLLIILRQVTGLRNIPIRIISVLPWQPTVKVVNDMQHGRIFLAGDAAHVMPPYGGKGASSGIQDVHNLAWKIAAVLNRRAGPALLKTYSAERQPVGLHNALQSGRWADERGLLVKNLAVVTGLVSTALRAGMAEMLGLYKISSRLCMRNIAYIAGLPDYQYTSTAIVNGNTPSQEYRRARALDGTAGTRMPHLPVRHQQLNISTLDLLGKRFVLFTGTDNTDWKQLIAILRLPVTVFSIGAEGDLIPEEKSITATAGIGNDGALLVRPDGFVAWKSKHFSTELESVWKQVMGWNCDLCD